MTSDSIPWAWEVFPHYYDPPGFAYGNGYEQTHPIAGLTLLLRLKLPSDEVCGATALDPETDEELMCNYVGDHSEVPHFPVLKACIDGECPHRMCKGTPRLVQYGVRVAR